ncbi:MAG: hypothetical protein IPL99_24695 [Candidatus Competibacteraceae bacterium]|nr:hypothetical protein [Candidatus Competibacteraceae bacterium]
MRNSRTTRRSARGVVGSWSRRLRWPTPAFRPSICIGPIRRTRLTLWVVDHRFWRSRLRLRTSDPAEAGHGEVDPLLAGWN